MLEPLQGSLQAAGLVDLDHTVLIQLGVFVVFALIFNKMVVQPLLKAQGARYSKMQGARDDAQSMDRRAADAVSDYETKHGAATQAGVDARDAIRTKAEQERDVSLHQVRAEIAELLTSGRAKLDAQKEQGYAAMQPQVEDLANQVVARVLETKQGAA